jgi:hypothetical protein
MSRWAWKDRNFKHQDNKRMENIRKTQEEHQSKLQNVIKHTPYWRDEWGTIIPSGNYIPEKTQKIHIRTIHNGGSDIIWFLR